ncbi:MAG: sulfatase-like hydrolase/transferase [Myxococcales bacterium]|jgi:membrane-anchored protein YejM (alkaline phosphatase superfamily)|nr:sulfatase-like hydrolase/transferase [Myxococcales bacterium]
MTNAALTNQIAVEETPKDSQRIPWRQIVKAGFIYYVFSTLVLAIEFLPYLFYGQLPRHLDAMGWLFYVSACLSHAALIALVPYAILYLPVALLSGRPSWGILSQMVASILLNTFVFINSYVFDLYKFHIDGVILDMLTGDGASEIFNFGWGIYFKAALILAFFIALNVFLKFLCGWVSNRAQRIFHVQIITALATLTLFATAYHLYAAAIYQPLIIKIAEHIPYYYPPMANNLLDKLGWIDLDSLPGTNLKNRGSADIDYPKHPIQSNPPERQLNVVMIGIDSWSIRAFTPEVMPNIHAFLKKSTYFANHLSNSNRTRGSLYGLFFSISAFYWDNFRFSGIRPVFFEEFLKQNYRIQFYPSASLLNPPIAQTVFADIPNLRTETPGASVYERDQRLTADFLRDLKEFQREERPFFAFLFYDLGHSPSLPAEKCYRFQPSWLFADYSKLNNSMDPTPYFNLYLNSMAEVDVLVGEVLDELETSGAMDDTIVLVVGDHGQEFNENKKNYWGHGGNFSPEQTHVPFLYYAPGIDRGVRYDHRTTHYDVAPTLLTTVLGVTNDPADYSMGRLLTDPSDRGWIPIGENLKRGFIAEDGIILKRAKYGHLEVTDRHLDELKDYKINSKVLDDAIQNLNRFYRKSE